LGERGGEPGAEGCEQQEYNNTLVEFGFHKVSRIWFVPDGHHLVLSNRFYASSSLITT
jgi:hypothetical protein